jgi:hypothetical protein
LKKIWVPIFILGLVFAIGWTTESNPEREVVENARMITAFAYAPNDLNCIDKVQDTFHQLGVTLSKEVCGQVKTGHPVDLNDI